LFTQIAGNGPPPNRLSRPEPNIHTAESSGIGAQRRCVDLQVRGGVLLSAVVQIAGAAGIRDDAIRHGAPERNSVHVIFLFHINDTGYNASLRDV
jgi:hypothetical protein